jgi:hypothetical protein
MPDRDVKTIKGLIYFQYAKLITLIFLTASLLIFMPLHLAAAADTADQAPERSLYFGLKAGFDDSTTKVLWGDKSYADGFFTAGVFVRHDINSIFALQLELNYFGTSIVINSTLLTVDYYTTSNYVQVPLLLKANYFLKPIQSSFYVDLGPVFDSLFALDTNMGGFPSNYMSFSGIIGLGIDFFHEGGSGIELEARVDRSIINNVAVNYTPAFIYFTLGYIF